MKWTVATAAGMGVLLAGSQAQAWFDQGHMMVSEIAWQAMSPGARCRAVGLLKTNSLYAIGLKANPSTAADEALFVNAATWPDRIKKDTKDFINDGDVASGPHAGDNVGLSDRLMHKYWHFVDQAVPDDPTKPPPSINAQERLTLFIATLSDPAASDDLKAYDLAWLLHLTGDIHQPLHVATQYGPTFGATGSDAGGNGVQITGVAAEKNLHAFWDGAPGDSEDLDVAVAAGRSLPAAPADKANVLDPSQWAQESHGLAETAAYVRPIKLGSVGPFKLTSSYKTRTVKVAKAQVALAGARLAKVLNAAFLSPGPGCSGS